MRRVVTCLASVASLAACGSSRTPPPPPPALAAPDAAVLDEVATLPPDAAVPVDDFERVATAVYAELAAGRVDVAYQLVENRPFACDYFVGVGERRGGGHVVYGGRIVLRLDAKGAIESRVVEDRCVAYVDDDVTITAQRDVDETVLKRPTAHPETLAGGINTVLTSRDWVLIHDTYGDYLAWARGAANVERTPTPPTATEPEADTLPTIDGDPDDDSSDPRQYVPSLAGPYLVLPARSRITLVHRDGSRMAVKGCPGTLLSAAPVPGGLALHVGPSLASASTKLCLVNDRGATRRVTQLGHAWCGLAKRMKCSWEMHATTSKLLVFTGLRGGVVVVDAKTGAKLPYRGEPDSQFPPDYSVCGDAICVATATDTRSDEGVIEVARGSARFVRKAAPPDPLETLKAAWCPEADLLLPCRPSSSP